MISKKKTAKAKIEIPLALAHDLRDFVDMIGDGDERYWVVACDKLKLVNRLSKCIPKPE